MIFGVKHETDIWCQLLGLYISLSPTMTLPFGNAVA